jgi:hypothetical protein
MSQVKYTPQSPYYTTPQTTWYLGVWNPRDIPRDTSDQITMLSNKYALRPDLLSYDLYGTTDYWWTFMILNPDIIKDPIYDMVSGLTIYTATPDRLASLLSS